MHAQRRDWESQTVLAERDAAIEGEHRAASVVRANPALAMAWTDGQLVSADAARSDIIRVEQECERMQQAIAVAEREKMSETLWRGGRCLKTPKCNGLLISFVDKVLMQFNARVMR